MGTHLNQLYFRSRSIAVAIATLLTLCAALVLPAQAQAQSPSPILNIEAGQDHWQLEPVMAVTQDIPGDAPTAQVIAGDYDDAFQQLGSSVPNFSGNDGTIWVRTAIANRTDQTVQTQLVLKYPQPRSIEFHVEGKNGAFDHYLLGSARSHSHPSMSRFPSAPLTLSPGAVRQVYLKIDSTGPVLLPFQLFSNARFANSSMRELLVFGLLAGIIFAVAIHAGLTFIATREMPFGWFVVFALSGASFILLGSGVAKALFWPGLSFNSNALILVAQGNGVSASAMFLASYLRLAETAPKMNRCVLALAVIAFLSTFSSPLPELPAQVLLLVGLLITPPILFGCTLACAWRGIEGARILLIGWTATQAGTVWIYLRALDIVPYTEANHFALPLAITFTVAQFSWALTSRARKAEHNAQHDALTGLPNRLRLELLAGRPSFFRKNVAGVLQVDLDGFKQVNDSLGHAAGDDVLRSAAQRLATAAGDHGTAFRTGGDEFVVLAHKSLPDSNLVALGNRIIAELSRPMQFRGETATIGASVGVAVPQSGSEEIGTVIERADAALYRAKRGGKGRVELGDLATERAVLGNAIEQMAA